MYLGLGLSIPFAAVLGGGVRLTSLSLDNFDFDENSPQGTHIANIIGADPDSPPTLYGSAGGRLQVVGAALQVGPTSTNFETEPTVGFTMGGDGYSLLIGTLTVNDIDETAPTFLSSNTASVDENATLSHTISVSESCTFTIRTAAQNGASVDYAQFELSSAGPATSTTLRWASNGTRDFETPLDAGGNNVYNVVVRASDGTNTVDQTLSVTVVNVAEAAPAVTFPLDFTDANLDEGVTLERASTGTYVNSLGQMATAAIDAPRFSYLGEDPALLVEPSRTNRLLWSADLTPGTWHKRNGTAVKTATGPDGVVNSASKFTASAAFGTVSQQLSAASAEAVTSLWARRNTGTGTIKVSQGKVTGSPTVVADWTNHATNSYDSFSTNGSGGFTGTRTAGNDYALSTNTVSITAGKLYRAKTVISANTIATMQVLFTTSGTSSASVSNGSVTWTGAGTRYSYFTASSTGSFHVAVLSQSNGTVTVTSCEVQEVELIDITADVGTTWAWIGDLGPATTVDPLIAVQLTTSADAVELLLQNELGAKATSYIPTASTTVTRAADVVTFTPPTDVEDVRYTFEDGSTQDVAITPNVEYTVPTNLDRLRIATIDEFVPADTTPDAFTFTDATGAALSTVQESNTITVAGLGSSTPVTITGGEYSKNGGAYTSAAGTAVNDDTFKVRHTSSASHSTATNTVLDIGGVTDTFTSTTIAAENIAMSFTPASTSVEVDLQVSGLGDGTVYFCIVTDGASAPSAAQIKTWANSGVSGAARYAVALAFYSTEIAYANATGLTASTTYDVYAVHEDTDFSAVFSSTFTTGA